MAIKGEISLQNLKRSTVSKHKKIYDKAIRIMGEGFSTPLLNAEEIEVIAEKYKEHGLRVHVTINGDISIRSKCDNWVVVDEGYYYVLYHEATVGSRGKNRHSHHIQDIFYDLDFLFASVVTHDIYKMNRHRPNLDEVQELVKSVSFIGCDEMINIQEFVYYS